MAMLLPKRSQNDFGGNYSSAYACLKGVCKRPHKSHIIVNIVSALHMFKYTVKKKERFLKELVETCCLKLERD